MHDTYGKKVRVKLSHMVKFYGNRGAVGAGFFLGGGLKTIFPMSPPGCNQAMGRNEVSCRKGGNV